MPTSHRFQSLEQRDINKETFVEPWSEAGLIVADSPADPAPSLRLENGQVAELDGRARADFDMLDFFIAAEAVLRGFSEIETTVGVARYAPFNALAILVGSQTGRGGVLTQCSVEESLGLQLAMKGLTSYAETLSVYGTERSFVDGDDTPWSKAILSAAYASRGVKVRFTSGTGSEALMGHAQGYSMLYLEARCLMVTHGAGSQAVQNGSISSTPLPESLPAAV